MAPITENELKVDGTHWSRLSRRFVAPSTMTPSFCWKPSISESSWLIVWFAYGWIWELVRLAPTVSISSMKITHGARILAASVENVTHEVRFSECKTKFQKQQGSELIFFSLNGTVWTNFSEIRIKIQKFSFQENVSEMWSAESQPSPSGYGCWNQNISRYLHKCHGWCCPGSQWSQVISNHVFQYASTHGSLSSTRKDFNTFAISVLRNDYQTNMIKVI